MSALTDLALPERLARQATRNGWHAMPRLESQIAAAIRAALDEAAKVAREHEIVLDDGPFAKWTTRGGRFGQQIAAAIEALKGPAPPVP